MDEPTLRMYAELLRHELAAWPDPAEAARIRATLDEALARPEGAARRALRRALGEPERVREWVNAGRRRDDLADRLMSAEAEDGIPARFLTTDHPEQVRTGTEFGLEVTITEQAAGRSSPVQLFAVPPAGLELRLKAASSAGLKPVGPELHAVRVPAHGDSEPRLFVFEPLVPGRHTVTIRAYLDGRPVGERTVVVTAGGTAYAETVRRSDDIRTLSTDPRDLTLQLDADGDGYRCWLFHAGDTEHGQVRSVPSALVTEVRRRLSQLMAEPEGTELGRYDLHALGLEAWSAVVPPAVRARFDDLMSQARSLSIVLDRHYDIPWELLLPSAGRDASGPFLAERLPVVRRIKGQAYQEVLRLRDAAYVGRPAGPDALGREIGEVSRVLGDRVRHRLPPFDDPLDLLRHIDAGQFDLLHLACHNESPEQGWQKVALASGILRAYQLQPAAEAVPPALAARHPLIFFNACGTADRVAETAMPAWAERFLAAGAGAFVGSGWEVRSRPARKFAAAFYTELTRGDVNLGEALLRARRPMSESGDPTRLAYAVYADVNAAVRWN